MKKMKTIFSAASAIIVMIALVACNKKDDSKKVLEFGQVSDINGKVYKTVKIGDQWWMAENLAVDRYNDGTPIAYIPNSQNDSIWIKADSALYTSINDSISGKLYNGYCVFSDKNLAPEGWHIATDEDWKRMEKYIGMEVGETEGTGWRGINEGNKLTTKYSVGWPDLGTLYGTDEFGFHAIPGGVRIFDGRTNISGTMAFWWTKTRDGENGWYRYIDINDNRIFRQHIDLRYGMSIRCVKD
jgi:uncharacterized protein (TIGR02145 family)